MIILESYRDLWLREKMDEAIGFYPREFYVFDNFSSYKVLYNGYLYSSVEEAYQAQKFVCTAPEIAESIKKCYSAHDAQRIARENKAKRRSDWEEVKICIMEELLRLKLSQNPYVRQKLLETKNYLLVEDSPKDSFWGWGPNRDGQNHLGKLWMKLRAEILEE